MLFATYFFVVLLALANSAAAAPVTMAKAQVEAEAVGEEPVETGSML